MRYHVLYVKVIHSVSIFFKRFLQIYLYSGSKVKAVQRNLAKLLGFENSALYALMITMKAVLNWFLVFQQ